MVKAKKSSQRRGSSAKKPATIRISPVVKMRVNPYALAYALAILSAACVLIMSFFGKTLGMTQFLFSYNDSLRGIIVGTVEGALWGLVSGYLLGWLYNRFA